MNHCRALAVAAGLTLVAGACGSPSSSETATTVAEAPGPDEPRDASPSTATDEPIDESMEEPALPDGDAVEPAAGDDAPPTEAAEPAAAVDSVLPDVDVVDLATGETVNLASFAPADRPILLWFWAPH